MPNSVQFDLPFPPSVNNYWRATVRPGSRFPSFYISERGKQFRTDVRAALIEAFGNYGPIDGRVKLEIAAFPPDRRVRDMDNFLKAILDALTAARVWVDDEQVDEIYIARNPPQHPGRVELRLSFSNDGLQKRMEF